ncbi:hypothetical protein JCM19275_1940 [Nonlabens ulvanivorans]|uniref:Uncharacterized protein n=1 Tax=Nonlabens ulvanivorans TaxID=906888 RepID=A0A090WJD7_NONUL|nr:hypothetical protein JCM19275_1940 [Nonlabens ulvanivorans]
MRDSFPFNVSHIIIFYDRLSNAFLKTIILLLKISFYFFGCPSFPWGGALF